MSASPPRHGWLPVAVATAIVVAGITMGVVASATAPGPQVSTLPTVPQLVGLSPQAAIEELKAVGLSYRLETRAPLPGLQAGTVLAQTPASGRVAADNTTVVLFVAPNVPGGPAVH